MTQPSVTELSSNDHIVKLIMASDLLGGELLFEKFHRGMMYLAFRECPENAEDVVQSTLAQTIKNIQAGELHNPSALPGYIRVILKRNIWHCNRQKTKLLNQTEEVDRAFDIQDKAIQSDPYRTFVAKERIDFLTKNLLKMNLREREILERFYLKEESMPQIMEAMHLNLTSFRLLKSRSKKKLEGIAQGRICRFFRAAPDQGTFRPPTPSQFSGRKRAS